MKKVIGSPPRVRGILRIYHIIAKGTRITPACAGNTQTCAMVSCKTRDHPRVCGEYKIITTKEEIESGSPPRVRGIH